MPKDPTVYILASKQNGTLYTGVTGDLLKRTWQHREQLASGFSKKYKTHNWVYYEQCGTMEQAITREKQLKRWRREWKIRLIEEKNPAWIDLWPKIVN